MPLYRNRLAALLAMLALALQALWPLLVHARPAQPGILVPLCTIEGVTHYLELPPGKSPLDESSSSHHEHCQLCVFGGDRLAALPQAPPPLLLLGEISAPGVSPLRFPFRESPLHPPAQPRAPPAAS